MPPGLATNPAWRERYLGEVRLVRQVAHRNLAVAFLLVLGLIAHGLDAALRGRSVLAAEVSEA